MHDEYEEYNGGDEDLERMIRINDTVRSICATESDFNTCNKALAMAYDLEVEDRLIVASALQAALLAEYMPSVGYATMQHRCRKYQELAAYLEEGRAAGKSRSPEFRMTEDSAVPPAVGMIVRFVDAQLYEEAHPFILFYAEEMNKLGDNMALLRLPETHCKIIPYAINSALNPDVAIQAPFPHPHNPDRPVFSKGFKWQSKR